MNKKRILSLMMALVMMLTSFTLVSAENTEAVATDAEVTVEEVMVPLETEEYKALYAMGFLGEETAEMDALEYVTRAQFTGWLFKLSGYTLAEHKTEDIPFIDVSTATPYYNEICTMCEMGIVNGTDPNMFSPKAHVTYAQACKLIMSVLGYKTYTEARYGEGLNGYISMAVELEIDDGVKNLKADSELTAEDAMTLLFNAGNAEVMKFSGINEFGTPIYETKGATLFESNDIYYNEGIMMSNGVASLESEDVAANTTIIGKESYVSADVDITNLLGCMVKYYYRDDKVERKLLWATEHTRFNTSVDLRAIDLARDDAGYTIENIVYYDRNGKKDSYRVSPVAIVLYNNSLYHIPTVNIMKPQTGTMKLIDNNDDEIYDIAIIEEFNNIFISGVSTVNNAIIDKYGDTLELSKYDFVKIMKDGVEIDFAEVPINALASYIEDADGTKIYIYITTASATGQLKSIDTKRGNPQYTFEAGTYRVSSTYNNRMKDYRDYVAAKASQTPSTVTLQPAYYAVNPQPGRTYTYYLDIDGEIANIDAPVAEKQYAFLMSAKEGPEYEDGIVYTRLLLSNGSKVSAIAKKKLIVDGERENAAEIIARASTRGSFEPQVIMIVMNDEGYITEVDFAKNSTNTSEYPYGVNSEEFSLDADGSMFLRNNEGYNMIAQKWMVYSNVVVFQKVNGLDDPEPYRTGNIGDIGSNQTTAMKLYDIREDLTVSAVYQPDAINAEQMWIEGVMLVDETDIIYKDGYEVRRVSGYCNGAYQQLSEIKPGVLPADTSRGDMIEISTYENGITAVKRIMKLSELKSNKTPRVITGANADSNPSTCFAQLYNATEKAVTVLTPPEWKSKGNITAFGFRGNYKILVQVYDTRTDEMYTADIADIHQIYKTRADGSLPDSDNLVMAVVMARYTSVRELILILY